MKRKYVKDKEVKKRKNFSKVLNPEDEGYEEGQKELSSEVLEYLDKMTDDFIKFKDERHKAGDKSEFFMLVSGTNYNKGKKAIYINNVSSNVGTSGEMLIRAMSVFISQIFGLKDSTLQTGVLEGFRSLLKLALKFKKTQDDME